jgi:hypothetical protein
MRAFEIVTPISFAIDFLSISLEIHPIIWKLDPAPSQLSIDN